MSSGSGPPPASSPSAAVAHPTPPLHQQPHQLFPPYNYHPQQHHQQHLLRQAAARGDLATCRRLLTAASAPGGVTRCVRFSRDDRGRSALHLAAATGHAAVVRLLLAHAAPGEVDSVDGGGCAALQRAAADGRDEVVHLLLAHGADVDRQDGMVSIGTKKSISVPYNPGWVLAAFIKFSFTMIVISPIAPLSSA